MNKLPYSLRNDSQNVPREDASSLMQQDRPLRIGSTEQCWKKEIQLEDAVDIQPRSWKTPPQKREMIHFVFTVKAALVHCVFMRDLSAFCIGN